jgi:broad specificity phosphatase PhoE
MKTVYFVRHGESEGNTGKYFQSFKTGLTELGREQATIVAKRCATLPVEVLISSTMNRTKETAEIIAGHIGKQPEFSDLFTERVRPSSIADSLQTDEHAAQIDAQWQKSFYTEGVQVEDGENFETLRKRAGDALLYLEQRPEENILVVTHGFFLRMVLTQVLIGSGSSPSEFRKIVRSVTTSNTGITVFGFENGTWVLRIWNDHAHLG